MFFSLMKGETLDGLPYLDHIRKCYGPNTILDNLTYSFPLKEVSVILGKSGCGKPPCCVSSWDLEKAVRKDLEVPHFVLA